MGHSSLHKEHRCLTTDGRILISRHVLFDENTFLFRTTLHTFPIKSPTFNTLIPSPSFTISSLLLTQFFPLILYPPPRYRKIILHLISHSLHPMTFPPPFQSLNLLALLLNT